MGECNFARLKKCMQRAEDGGELTIGFFGGSITQGSLAEEPENTYSRQVFTWWEKTFPRACFQYVNGGIGGTTSHFGAARVVSDMLMYQPDLVIVDFSVNDEANEFFQETYEGVLRKLLQWESKPAVILLNNVYYDTGKNSQEYHNALGAWYQIPHVSIRDTLYQKMKQGEYTREELTPDGLHPNDKGHRLVAKEIIYLLEDVKSHLEEKEEEISIPQPMTANAYEDTKRLTIRECIPKLCGFRADTSEKTGHLDFFKNGWIGKTPGNRILFEIEASCLAVQYKKTIHRPALRANLILDGDKEHPLLLDGNFEEDWGDCLYLEPILHHGKTMVHTVEIIVLQDEVEQAEPFYLLSLIVA